jgi:hypothetical protein
MSYWRCELCDIGVPSSYQKEQHLEGSKHAARVRYFNSQNRSNFIAKTVLNREASASIRTFKILYTRDTSSAITKATSDLKSSVKERFKSIITVEYDEDSRRIHFLFPYDADFMNLIKTHIQGRTWNSIYKRWEAPLTSAVDIITLCKTLDISLPEELESMTPKQREIIISIANGDERAEVDFAYDATVVLAIKKLNPINRNYHATGDKKFWTVDVICLTDLVHHLLEDLQDVKIPKELVELMKEVTDKLYGFEDKENNDTNNLNSPSPKKHKPDANKDPEFTIDLTGDTDVGTIVNIIDKSGFNMNVRNNVPPAIPVPISNSTMPSTTAPFTNTSPNASPLKRKFGELTTNPLSSNLKSLPTFDESSGKIKWPDCEECGKKKEKNHHCRFFGQYECSKCRHTWASAYAWKGEKQECRDCFTMTCPYQLTKLKKKSDDDLTSFFGNGPHESSLCSMCKKLGRPCNFSMY